MRVLNFADFKSEGTTWHPLGIHRCSYISASQAMSVGVKKKIPQAPNLISKKLDVTTGEMQAFQGRLGNASASFAAFQAKC